jgi:hypothetical protein
MEFKTVTCKTLVLSAHEKDLLEDTAILLSHLFQEDIINQIFNQIIDEAVGGCPGDFEDIANILHELANDGHVIEETK